MMDSFFLSPQKKESTAKLVEPPRANANMDVARDMKLKRSSGAVSELTTRIPVAGFASRFRKVPEFMIFWVSSCSWASRLLARFRHCWI